MSQKKIAIVDDNYDYGMYIKKITDECFEHPKITVFERSEEILKSEEKYDMTFLDIDIDGKDGIELSKKILDRTDYIVYVSSQLHRVTDAFGYKTVGFLPKGMEEKQLREKMTKLYGEYMSGDFVFQSDNGYVKTNQSSIMYITALNRKMFCFMKDGKNVRIHNMTVTDVMKQLNSDMFFLIDRGTAVNLNDVISVKGTEVKMSNGTVLYVSRRLKNGLEKEWLARF